MSSSSASLSDQSPREWMHQKWCCVISDARSENLTSPCSCWSTCGEVTCHVKDCSKTAMVKRPLIFTVELPPESQHQVIAIDMRHPGLWPNIAMGWSYDCSLALAQSWLQLLRGPYTEPIESSRLTNSLSKKRQFFATVFLGDFSNAGIITRAENNNKPPRSRSPFFLP